MYNVVASLEEIVEGCVLFRVNSGREDASAMANDFGEIGMSLASQPMTIDWLKDNVRYRPSGHFATSRSCSAGTRGFPSICSPT